MVASVDHAVQASLEIEIAGRVPPHKISEPTPAIRIGKTEVIALLTSNSPVASPPADNGRKRTSTSAIGRPSSDQLQGPTAHGRMFLRSEYGDLANRPRPCQ